MNFCVLGLGFGDESKGSIVDALVRKTGIKLVVRHGGPQAAHHVVLDDGRSHCFSQIGAGSLAGADTYLSRFMLVDPPALANEATHLIESFGFNPYAHLIVDRECVVVTPYHKAMTRLRERARRGDRHGSTGMGVWDAHADAVAGVAVRVGDLHNWRTTFKHLKAIKDRKFDQCVAEFGKLTDPRFVGGDADVNVLCSEPDAVADDFFDEARRWILADRDWMRHHWRKPLILEGSQGVLLDPVHGFKPYVTATDCTAANAMTVLAESDHDGPLTRLGVLRSYATRHGAGPFPTEATRPGSLWTDLLTGEHNGVHPWQGAFRLGHFDAELARYALRVCPVDALALTHLDKIVAPWWVCSSYVMPPPRADGGIEAAATMVEPRFVKVADADEFVATVERLLRVPIAVRSSGPTASQKVWTLP